MQQKQIKIVYIISTLIKSGPVNVLYNIVKHLDKNKFDVTIITLSPEPKEHSRIDEFRILNINIKSISLSRIQGYLYGGFKLKKIVDKIRPDVIHTHCFRSNLFSALFLSKYKRCSTVHSDYKADLIDLFPGILGNIIFVLNHISLMLIKNNICCSEILANMLNYRYKYLHFSYVNNGIDTTVFKPIEDKLLLRKKLQLPLDKIIFIWVGSFIERKNPKMFLNVIKKINDSGKYFIFCGDGPLFNNIKNQIQELSNVILTGRIENVLEFLQASDYYISTSLSEGLPMSVMEGLACGNNCFLTNIAQHQIFKGNFINFYNTNDEKQLQELIESESENDNKYSHEIIYKYINENFSAAIMTKLYEKEYIKLNGGYNT